MAEEWIKVRKKLRNETEVKEMASRLGISRPHVLWGLLGVWSLADEHAIERIDPEYLALNSSGECHVGNGTFDGTDAGAGSGDREDTKVPTEGFLAFSTLEDIDHEAGQVGFGQAMVAVGWLRVYADGIGFPRFDIHNSKASKKRASEQKRKATQRKREQQGRSAVPPDVPQRTGQKRGQKAGRRSGQTAGPEGEGDKKENKRDKEIKNQKGGGGEFAGAGSDIDLGDAGGVGDRSVRGGATPSSGENFERKELQRILEAWDEIAGVSQEHARISDDRLMCDPTVERLVLARLRDPHFAENWERGLRYVRSSDLCCGKVTPKEGFQQPWRASLKWFCSAGKLEEILGGKHGGRADGLIEEDEDEVFEEIRREAERMEAEQVQFERGEGVTR